MTTATAPVNGKTAGFSESAPKYRIESIDILRGLVMLIMAIDHVRDFLHYGHLEPTDLAITTPFFFFTRFITHFCAPTFVFLSGMSAYLAGTRRTPGQLSMFLIKRGFWLIAVELLVVNLAMTANPAYPWQVLQVIWAIGGSMILLGLLTWSRASLPVIGAIGAILVFGHDILDVVKVRAISDTFIGKLFLSGKGFGDFWPTNHDQTRGILFGYALLPWAGIMMIGYIFGSLYVKAYDAAKRRRTLLYLGLSALAAFLLLRFFNIYGDPSPWHTQKTGALSIISFFNVSKYPPSLLYTLMTVGAAMLTLSLIENVKNKFTTILYTYGNVPFFYYLCHWYLIRLITIGVFFITGHNSSQVYNPKQGAFLFQPDDIGFPLFGVYLTWFAVIAILYLPCRWYGKYKRTHTEWWLSYL